MIGQVNNQNFLRNKFISTLAYYIIRRWHLGGLLIHKKASYWQESKIQWHVGRKKIGNLLFHQIEILLYSRTNKIWLLYFFFTVYCSFFWSCWFQRGNLGVKYELKSSLAYVSHLTHHILFKKYFAGFLLDWKSHFD